MGQASQRQIANYERGYTDDIDKNVCGRHFENIGIIKYVHEHGASGTCSYCDEDSPDAVVIALSDLLEHIVQCLYLEFANPDDAGVSYESREGGYLHDEIYDTHELLGEQVDLYIEDDDLWEDITGSITNEVWCPRRPYELNEGDELVYTWNYFASILKHESRYVFFKTDFIVLEERLKPYEVLDEIGKLIYKLKLYRTLSEDAPLFPTVDFYRARQHRGKDKVNSAKTLGPPPKEWAIANRMSPAGISMFYCSDTRETALAETLDPTNKGSRYISVGIFQNTRDLRIIDLTNLPEVSLFDEEKNSHYQGMQFLHRFVRDVIKPITRDGREHIEYVPTQVVTEYFRYVFSTQYKIEINGIKYPSSKMKGSSCYVLFFGQDDVADDSFPAAGRKSASLVYKKGSVERRTVK